MPGERFGLPERLRARRELVEEHAERVEIAARIAAVVLQLLGRHVSGGARSEVLLLAEQVRIARMTGESEVEQDRFAGGSQQDIFRLEVEVDHFLRMHAVDGIGKRSADPRDFFRRQRRAAR